MVTAILYLNTEMRVIRKNHEKPDLPLTRKQESNYPMEVFVPYNLHQKYQK